MANHLLDTKFLYTFESFFHPYVGFLREKLNEGSLAQLLSPATQGMKDDAFFAKYYTEGDGEGADGPFEIRSYPKKNIDLEDGGAYATYNWELFFHIPLTIAVHLSKNQRFADAQRWFHYVFDPTSTDDVPSPGRYWKFLAFRENNDVGFIEDILAQWAAGSLSEDDRRRLVAGYDRLKEAPFEPHVVARTRTVSYQYSVVMRYLDNLIAWGDSLFRQDTIETINEATMLYVLAANILGPRPQRVPPAGKIQPRTFNQIKDLGRMRCTTRWSRWKASFRSISRLQKAMAALAPAARCGAWEEPSTSAFPETRSCSGTGTRWPIGSSSSGTA